MAAAGTPSRIPAGYRFHPTDFEIISFLGILLGDDDRLKEQIRSLNVIQWVDVYSVQPWELFNMFYNHQVHIGGDGDGDHYGGQEAADSYLYFVSPLKKKTEKGTRISRTVQVVKGVGVGGEGQGSSVTVGTWKPQSGPIHILDSRTGMLIGVKKATSFVPSTKTMPEEDINEEYDIDTITSTSNSSCSKKRKKAAAPEEMQPGISYIMHQFTLCSTPTDDQDYSLCRIRRKIDKKVMKTMINNKKMKRSSSPNTNTTNTPSTTTTTCSRECVVQADQEERAAGYDHGKVMKGISFDDIMLSCKQTSSDYDKRPIHEIEEFLFAEEVPATTGGDLLYYDNDHEENIWFSIDGEQQQQQEAVVAADQGDAQISDDNKGFANAIENFGFYGFDEEFLSRLKQEVAAPTTGGDDLLY